MKALRKLSGGSGNVAVVETPVPVPEEDQVLIRVERAGICGTDLHIFHGLFSKVKPPVTLGHEISGTVEALGCDVTGWRSGDKVTVESEAYSCGKCQLCESGFSSLCPDRLALGYGVDGGFASFLAVRKTALHRLPEGATFQEGALCEPLTVAVHAVLERSNLEKGSWTLVTGPGPIGLLVDQVARHKGAKVIMTGTDKDQKRLQVARSLGVDAVINVDRDDLQKEVMELTSGQGVETAFECSGVGAAINDCLACVKRRGEIIQVGLSGRFVEMDVDQVAMKEITLKGAFVHNHESWIKAIALLAEGAIDLNSLVSGEYPITEWQEAFRLSEEGSGIKYLLYPV
ncbi:MAG: zinc-binding dehydrogenase [Syntrophaceae bacterium]|nr:zinc-binding dehydrogenase [Syntrophaceae bacterium]